MKEEEVKITATLKFEVTVPGDIVSALKNNNKDEAYQIAHSLVEDAIDCFGYASRDLIIDDIECELI